MSTIAHQQWKSIAKRTEYRQWVWRYVQDVAPEGWGWCLRPGGLVLFDTDGSERGRFGNRQAGAGRVLLDDEEYFTLAEWVAWCRGIPEIEAQAQIEQEATAELAVLDAAKTYTVDQTPWGMVQERTGTDSFLGPLRTGVNVIYGVQADVALDLLLEEARKRQIVVACVQELALDNGAAERIIRTKGEAQGLVVLRQGPRGSVFSRERWRRIAVELIRPLVRAGWVIVLRGEERRRRDGDVEVHGVSVEHLRGDPCFFAQCSLVSCSSFADVHMAAETLVWASDRAEETVPIESRLEYRQEVAAMTVRRRGVAKPEKEKVGRGSVSPDGPGAGSGEPEGSAGDLVETEADGSVSGDVRETVEELQLFTVDGPTGCDSPQGRITPVPDVPEFREEPERDSEIIVGYRGTDDLLTRVWIILARKQVVAYDSGTLWVLTAEGQWVNAEEDIKHLRWRLYNEICWTDYADGRRYGRRVAHRALLELADLMVLMPEKRLDPRPQARDGRVVKITEMEPLIGRIVALDTETSGPGDDGPLDPRKNFIELVQINDGVRTQLMTTRGCTTEEITEGFRKIFEHADVVVGHNLSFDLPTIWAKTQVMPKAVFDTMIAAAILKIATQKTYGGAVNKGLGLAQVAEKYLGVKISKEQQRSDWGAEWTVEQLEYAARDVQYLHALMEKQIEELNKLDAGATANAIGLKNRVARLEMAMVLVMVEATVRGIPVNLVEVERQIQEAHKAEMAAEEAFHKQYPLVQNINSAPQIKQAFAEDGVVLPDLTAETVNQYLWHPGVRLYSEYKTAVQVYRNLKRYREEVVYPSWYVIGAGSGRMSSSGPGVQNVPKVIKPKFYSPSLTIVKADYPAIESRLAAVYAGEQGLIEAFNAGEDIHVLTASKVMGKDKTEVQKSERQLAKALNYGLLYGVGAARFAAAANADYGLSITVEQASEFREKFFDAYPALREWHHKTAQALRSGKGMRGRTLFGRVMAQGEEDYTDALNYPIQGSGADLLKLAAVKVWQDLKAFEGRARILNLVHDEIVVAVMDPAVKAQVAMVVRDAMEEAARKLMPQVKTPVEVDIVDAEQPGLLELM